MANRIFYAVQQVSIGPDALGQYQVVKGVQSVSMTTTFNLEQAFELGQLEIYENIEGVPNIEMTVNRLLDGNPLLYVLASATQNSDAYSRADDINLASSNESVLKLGIWDEASYSNAQNGVAPTNEVSISGAVMSSVSYTFGVDGNFTEEVSFTATDKAWGNTSCTTAAGWADDLQNGVFAGTDIPKFAGGVQRRQYFDTTGSTIPSVIPEGSSRLQSVSVSADFGREDLFELGSKGPFAKVATFPLEVTCSIEVLSSGGDKVNAMAESCSSAGSSCSSAGNLTDQQIVIKTCDGTVVDLGQKNKLQSVSYGGGDAGGGNVTTTFDFVTFNKLSVSGTGTVNFA
jgi:hypothetical protein|tara:strand:+ start:145 stop:1176 length:1032 start_codon:yes stop_codon:yes gene_type:complete